MLSTLVHQCISALTDSNPLSHPNSALCTKKMVFQSSLRWYPNCRLSIRQINHHTTFKTISDKPFMCRFFNIHVFCSLHHSYHLIKRCQDLSISDKRIGPMCLMRATKGCILNRENCLNGLRKKVNKGKFLKKLRRFEVGLHVVTPRLLQQVDLPKLAYNYAFSFF